LELQEKMIPLSQVLLMQLLLDVGTERHQTFVLLAVLCVVAAECNELFANGRSSVRLALAILGVRHNALHLLTRWKTTICIATLTGVHQRLNATLNRLFASFLWIRLGTSVGCWRGAIVQIESETLHFVGKANLLFAWKTQIVILRRERERMEISYEAIK